MNTLSIIEQCINNSPFSHVMILGDCNANPKKQGRVDLELGSFCEANSLFVSDQRILSAETFTFYSLAHNTTSWLDHIICSYSCDSAIIDMNVDNSFVSSDHLPICCTIYVNDTMGSSMVADTCSQNSHSTDYMFSWSGVDNNVKKKYSSLTNRLLCQIDPPIEAIMCQQTNCTKHQQHIDMFYNSIIDCLQSASSLCLSKKPASHSHSAIAGWNEYVKASHAVSRDAFLWWQAYNKPRHGPIFDEMRSSRAQFKRSLRICKQNEQTTISDKLAESLKKHDATEFWKEVSKHNKKKCAAASNIDGVVGERQIAEQWRNYYYDILNSCTNFSSRESVDLQCSDLEVTNQMVIFVDVIKWALNSLKTGKAAGIDGLTSESLIHAGHGLCVLLSMCFTAMFKHSYIPKSMLDSIIVPIIKNKCGDISAATNYRPIAVSNILSKVLELVILFRIEHYLSTTDNQFGYKRKLGTDMCIYTLHETIDILKQSSSSVFISFLDASKAFDKVNHWLLFDKLLKRNVPLYIVKLLVFWYQHQRMAVRWGTHISSFFRVTNSVRQGSILSPKLFSIYMDDLSVSLNALPIGCNVDGTLINHLLYADDICLISLSSAGLQKLLNTCEQYCASHDITFNTNKCYCMCIKSKQDKHSLPTMYLCNQNLSFVDSVKYLGVHIDSSQKSDNDVKRQLKTVYGQANELRKCFMLCTYTVKCTLFSSYCTAMYCSPLWFCSTAASLQQLKVAYNNALRRLLGIPTYHSAREMFVNLGLPSFPELIRKHINLFVERLESSKNHIIFKLVQSVVPLFSNIWKFWFKQTSGLYV